MKSILLKLTLIVSLCFFANLSYGQTKEETIEWLKEKLTNYAGSSKPNDYEIVNFKVERITECEIILTYTTKAETYGSDIRLTFPTTQLSDKRMEEIPSYFVIYDKPLIKYQRLITNETYYRTGFNECVISDRDKDNLPARVIKAIKHLGTFCQKKKESF